MKKTAIAILCSLAVTMAAHAQATRTWVSGVGDDANPCSRTAPCKTFAGAISKTAALGEIDVLDPGGFGGVTITKSITIDGGPFEAGVLVPLTPGISINASSTDVVTLRNLDINGVGTGTVGIRVLNATGFVHIENVVIKGFAGPGVSIEGTNPGTRVAIRDSTIHGCTGVNGNGIVSRPGTGGSVFLTMDNVRSEQNAQSGVDLVSTTLAMLYRSSIVNNSVNGVLLEAANTRLNAKEAVFMFDGNGIKNGNTVGTGGTVLLAGCMLTGNTVGLQNNGNASGFQDNAFGANGTDVGGASMTTILPR